MGAPRASVVTDEMGHELVPRRYLRAGLVVARSARPGEYAVVYLSTGTFFRTDWLGALAVRGLIAGRSDAEVMEIVERTEAGAGARARQLVDILDAWSAMTWTLPFKSRLRRRRLVALAMEMMGVALGLLGPLVRIAPTAFLVWLFAILPSTPIAHHVWRCTRMSIIANLQASGYADRPGSALRDIGRRGVAEPLRNYLFMYLSTVLSASRLSRLVTRLFDRDSAESLAVCTRKDGPTVGVFLHGPLCVAVPNTLRARGQEVVRVVVPRNHGMYVSELAGPLRDFFGESPEMAVDATDPNVSGALLRHLKGGRNVYVALDEPARERNQAAEIVMLGRSVQRNDGPAWLAVRSGRPLALWTTYWSQSGVVVTAAPLLHADVSLPTERRVVELSERLYACVETAIREHPEAWGSWSYLSLIKGHRV